MSTKRRLFKRGVVVFKEGDKSDALFLVQKGTVLIEKTKGVSRVTLAKVGKNQVIGELAFFDRKPRSASAVCETDVELLEIPFDGLDKLYLQVPPYLKTIVGCVVERLRNANQVIQTLQQKYAGDVAEVLKNVNTIDAVSDLQTATLEKQKR